MSRIAHTTPAAFAEAAARHLHHRHVRDFANEIKRIGTWLSHPRLSGLSSLVHYLEVAVIACALALLLIAAGRVVRLILRRRAAEDATCSRVVLPESFERQALVGFFRTMTSLLRPYLVGVPAWVSFTFATVGQQLEI